MKIAFEVFGGSSWTGGINYLVNLLAAVNELPGRPIEPVLFASPDTDAATLARITPFLSQPPVLSNYWKKGSLAYRTRILKTLVTGCDQDALRLFRQVGIDVTFVHVSWFGGRFPIPTIVWIGDFQHRALPSMFSRSAYAKRELGFRLLTKYGTTIVASSNVGCAECRNYFPNTRGAIESLPFVVRVPAAAFQIEAEVIKRKYDLPERFFYVPNQFWLHKNHAKLFEAVDSLVSRGETINVVCSGNPCDPRNPDYYDGLNRWIETRGLSSSIRLLGMIPYEDIFALMRASHAMINPSLYEGWSTTVEEAKAIGVPMILSGIDVHREQANAHTSFMNPYSATDMADVLLENWKRSELASNEVRTQMYSTAAHELPIRRRAFAEKFLAIAERTHRPSTLR